METFSKPDKQLVPRSPSWASHKKVSIYRLLHVPCSGHISGPRTSRAVSQLCVVVHRLPPSGCPSHRISHLHGKTHLPFKAPQGTFSSVKPSSYSEKYSPPPAYPWRLCTRGSEHMAPWTPYLPSGLIPGSPRGPLRVEATFPMSVFSDPCPFRHRHAVCNFHKSLSTLLCLFSPSSPPFNSSSPSEDGATSFHHREARRLA